MMERAELPVQRNKTLYEFGIETLQIRRWPSTSAAKAAIFGRIHGSAEAEPFQNAASREFSAKGEGESFQSCFLSSENPHPNLAQDARLGWGTQVS
jgi:hypothetical protein